MIHFKTHHCFNRIRVWSLANEWIEIQLTSVIVKRLNYPYNCFTLDLSENKDIKSDGLKQIFFDFFTRNGSSVELLLEDKMLACNREIKNNKFYFSGTNIELKDLGKRKVIFIT